MEIVDDWLSKTEGIVIGHPVLWTIVCVPYRSIPTIRPIELR